MVQPLSSKVRSAKVLNGLDGFEGEILGCGVVVARGNTRNFEYPVTHLLTPEDLV
jgi:hypothetical protein